MTALSSTKKSTADLSRLINNREEQQVINKSFNIQSKFTEDKVWVTRVVDRFLVWLYLFDLVWFFFFFAVSCLTHSPSSTSCLPHRAPLMHQAESRLSSTSVLITCISLQAFQHYFLGGGDLQTAQWLVLILRSHHRFCTLFFFLILPLYIRQHLFMLVQRIEHPARAEVEMERSIRF